MNLYLKIGAVVSMGIVTCASFLPAQNLSSVARVGKAVQTANRATLAGSRSFESALRRGGRTYIGTSVVLGREARTPLGASSIGNVAQHRCLEIQRQTGFLGNKISRLIAQQIMQIPFPDVFPGFVMSFPTRWKAFVAETKTSKGRIGVILEAAFGEGEIAEGTFVRSFEELRHLALTPVENPVTCEQAVKDAFKQAEQVKDGFFVVRIKGNDHRPKDTLVLDIENPSEGKAFRWISFNQSKAIAWEEDK